MPAAMKLVVFGLTVSSSWGNGHATLWRGLLRALSRRGFTCVFFERDVPYYARHRDLAEPDGARLVLYPDWESARGLAEEQLRDADVGMVTSFCPDGLAATEAVLASRAAVKAFYDLDTPVTLEKLAAGEPLSWIGPRGLADFDVVLSYTGGAAPEALQSRLAARRVVPLYGSVDPEVHRPAPAEAAFRGDLSYLGTYAEDRQEGVLRLFVEPARRRPDRRFVLGGSMYPAGFPWTRNIAWIPHVVPADHPAFYASSPITLSVTRRPMAEMGWCPSGRLFEAAACGVPVLSDAWEGLDSFFTPGSEILTAGTTEEAVAAVDAPRERLARIGRAARERTLAEHTADRRAEQLEAALAGRDAAAPRAGAR
jgi:spore maturation protein CgeB